MFCILMYYRCFIRYLSNSPKRSAKNKAKLRQGSAKNWAALGRIAETAPGRAAAWR